MTDVLHRVNPDTCKGDAICVDVCPEDNRGRTALTLGHPEYRYRGSIRRNLAGVRTA